MPPTKPELVLLTSHNYHTWSHVMVGQLEEEGHWPLVSGLEEYPGDEPDRPNSADYTPDEKDKFKQDVEEYTKWRTAYVAFEKIDAKARGFIRNRLDETQKILVKDAATAKDMWDILTETHKMSKGGVNVILKKIEIGNRRWDGRSSKSLANHFDWLIRTNDELASVDRALADNDLAVHMLCSIPAEHNSAATALYARYGQAKSFDDLNSTEVRNDIENTFKWHFRDEETPTSNLVPPVTAPTLIPTTALAADSSAKTRLRCSHCRKLGHLQEKCYDLHPELRPQGWKSRSNPPSSNALVTTGPQISKAQAQEMIALLTKFTTSDDQAHTLIASCDVIIHDALATKLKTARHDRIYVDSGSSRHLCPHIDWSSSLTQCKSVSAIIIQFSERILEPFVLSQSSVMTKQSL
jgi:hypothetical protein